MCNHRPVSARGSIRAWLLCGLLAVMAAPALAVTCSVSTAGLAFGSYDPFGVAPLDSAGNIAVSCDAVTPYTISLSTGAGTYANRRMSSAGNVLNYNLYTDLNRITVWGDGSAGTSTVAGNASSANHTVYGRIPAGQNTARVGSYADSVTITLSF